MPGEPFDLNAANCFVLHKQHLDGSSAATDIVRLAGDIGGLHNTGPSTPYLSLFARVPGFSRNLLDEEMYVHKSLIRIRCMRNTMHILPRNLIPKAFTATQPITMANAERYLQHRGVSDDEYRAVSQKIVTLLAGGGMTLPGLKKALGPVTNISAVLTLLCDRGFLIRGRTPGWRSNAYTYHLFKEYLPDLSMDSVDENDATSRLVELHLSAFGPATVNDIAWWSGLGKTKVLKALKALPVEHISIQGLNGDFLVLDDDLHALEKAEAPSGCIVNLLPGMDPYIMGYKDRDRYLSKEHYAYIFDRSGNSTNTILVNGRVCGVWDFQAEAKPEVKFFLLDNVAGLNEEIVVQAKQIGKFIAGQPVSVRECRSMVPLTARPPGGVLSPLKGQ